MEKEGEDVTEEKKRLKRSKDYFAKKPKTEYQKAYKFLNKKTNAIKEYCQIHNINWFKEYKNKCGTHYYGAIRDIQVECNLTNKKAEERSR